MTISIEQTTGVAQSTGVGQARGEETVISAQLILGIWTNPHPDKFKIKRILKGVDVGLGFVIEGIDPGGGIIQCTRCVDQPSNEVALSLHQQAQEKLRTLPLTSMGIHHIQLDLLCDGKAVIDSNPSGDFIKAHHLLDQDTIMDYCR